MPQVKCDNRLRINIDLWIPFLDKCADQGVPYRAVIEALITLYLLDKINPYGVTHQAIIPQEIPQISPSTDSLVQSLLDGDLFA